MSLSRDIALADDKTLEQIFTALAREVFVKNLQHRNGDRAAFDAWVRPHFRKLHAGGMSKERLHQLKKLSRQIFRNTKESMMKSPQDEGSQKPASNANRAVEISDQAPYAAGPRRLHSSLPERVFCKPPNDCSGKRTGALT